MFPQVVVDCFKIMKFLKNPPPLPHGFLSYIFYRRSAGSQVLSNPVHTAVTLVVGVVWTTV